MTGKKSAGILLFRRRQEPEYFLVHPGGPYWVKKDTGAWSIPKGEFGDEDPREAALREFAEETGVKLHAALSELGSARLKSGKQILAYAAEGELDETKLVSNTIEIEWPPRSGRKMKIPEVDRGEWFSFNVAKIKINPAQRVFLETLHGQLG